MNDYMKALHQRFFWELERPSLSQICVAVMKANSRIRL